MAALLIFAAAQFLCAPWGDYPLADDWQYARTAKIFAETGSMAVDTAVAPSVVGQSLIAAPFILLFGFSHTVLRILTLVLSAIGLWAMDWLLHAAKANGPWRVMVLLCVALNPLFFFLSATYMTEVWGYVPALLAACVWFSGRQRSQPDDSVIPWAHALATGAILGSTFWIRQYCVILFPALLLASGVTALRDRSWTRISRSFLPVLGSCLVFALAAGLYFPWARATGNYKPEFSNPLATMASFNGHAWAIQTIIFVAYISVFFAPLLMSGAITRRWYRFLPLAGVILSASYLGSSWIGKQGAPEVAMRAWLKSSFPYLHNIFFNAGLGPVTFAEVYEHNLAIWPQWSATTWEMVALYSIVTPVLWSFMAPRVAALFKNKQTVAVEVFLFGAFAAVLSLGISIQAFQMAIFDRYHFPGMLGIALSLGVLLGTTDHSAHNRARSLVFGLAWAAMALFSVAGLHDYFRWNDARWELVEVFEEEGHSVLNLQGGYEVNGWLTFDAFMRKERPPACGEDCHCRIGWYCLDDTYWLGMAPPDATYQQVHSILPRYWLAKGPPVSLYRRGATR